MFSQPHQSRSEPHLLTLILVTALSTMTLNMFVPSLVSIAADLQTDYTLVSLSVGTYLAAMTIVQLIVGPLSDRIGRRPVLLSGLFIFTLSSLLCALSTNIWGFLFFRMLQSAMVAGYVLSMAIVRDTTTEQESASRIGYISMAMALAPMLGPVLGGVLDGAFGWRSNFYFLSLSGLTLFLWCWFDLGETKKLVANNAADSSDTLLNLIKEPIFWAYALCTAFSTTTLYIFLTGAPLVAESEFGISPTELGLYFASGTAGFMFGSFLSGRFATSSKPVYLMMAGRLVACLGLSVGCLAILFDVLSAELFFSSIVFVGLGNGLTIPSSNAQTMSIRPNLAGGAVGISGAITVAIGAPLSMFTGAVLPESGASTVLLLMMLGVSVLGLLSVIWAWHLQQQQLTG
ncbi:MAG: DHA1 family bicyclomycin/chloramphenicol resistance-like MFS transporter [Granulosicoccus sp.]|jgi:DHA1 family bicyclomycin/chloramphenicol resistance-like MFS transporter